MRSILKSCLNHCNTTPALKYHFSGRINAVCLKRSRKKSKSDVKYTKIHWAIRQVRKNYEPIFWDLVYEVSAETASAFIDEPEGASATDGDCDEPTTGTGAPEKHFFK